MITVAILALPAVYYNSVKQVFKLAIEAMAAPPLAPNLVVPIIIVTEVSGAAAPQSSTLAA